MKIKNIELCDISELLKHGNANSLESCRWVDDTSECWQSPQVSISFSHFLARAGFCSPQKLSASEKS